MRDWPGFRGRLCRLVATAGLGTLLTLAGAGCQRSTLTPAASAPAVAQAPDGTQLASRTAGDRLQVYSRARWQEHQVRGVNMGMAVPGKVFWQHQPDPALYGRWFEMIGRMNANTVRVYELVHPTYYAALRAYNLRHPDRPLYLLQEVWPNEHVKEAKDLLDERYIAAYSERLRDAVHALHGNLPNRWLDSTGKRESYTADVSPWLLGWLVGREFEPDEVKALNQDHAGYEFQGEYLRTSQASPMESWLARCADILVGYEHVKYGWQHPVGIVSWPTLDPAQHDAEWNRSGDKNREYNDSAVVDIRHLRPGPKLQGGLFGAYHIYPNYPEFMNNELAYTSYRDAQGRFMYGGYLREFRPSAGEYPAIVAEFGVATGAGCSQRGADGLDHGGLTEAAQGRGLCRMMDTIVREGYAGGLVFEWMDEWAKRTWITTPYMVPFDRHPKWFNAIDPEQNYGLLALEPRPPAAMAWREDSPGPIRRLEMTANEGWLFLDITFERKPDFTHDTLLLGLDTVGRDRGEFRYAPDLALTAPSGLEFLVEITGGDACRLRAIPSYNVGTYRFSPATSRAGIFEDIRRPIREVRYTKDGRTIPPDFEDASALLYGDFTAVRHAWNLDGKVLHLRLPWARLNVTDPSSHQVLDDTSAASQPPRGKDVLKTVATDGVVVTAVLLDARSRAPQGVFPGGGAFTPPKPYLWPAWEEPQWRERLKDSYPLVRQCFGKLAKGGK